MNDGPQGFRSIIHPGTSTQWPCALNIASSWDREMASKFGSAMGEEFRGKGANVQLGPGVNIARAPLNGRNFEYISGEDPFLGSAMVQPIVKGIQSQGVMANAKHFVDNNQETNRRKVSAQVSERAQWEIYYPPFQAAVDAGVLSVMCSYNKINGTYACENKKTLDDLKFLMGFNGWVMSDWGATHSLVEAVNAGLDQEMWIDRYWRPSRFEEAIAEGSISMTTIDDKITRILTSMYEIGLLENKFKYGRPRTNVTSEEHNRLARDLTSTILLKNEGNFLPLPTTMDEGLEFKIAVVGDTGSDDPITGGRGSGVVRPYYAISPLQGIQNAIQDMPVSHQVEYHPSTDISEDDIESILQADIVIYCSGTVSIEGSDRENLSLPEVDESLIALLAESVGYKMVVSVVTPGAILMPWSDQVQAIILQFLPGQEAGNALADVLFGNVSPSGKLPITIPNKENEVQFSEAAYPGLPANDPEFVYYEEELFVGYRWYHAFKILPKFAFGFGLSYATFELNAMSADFAKCSTVDQNCEIFVNITRTDEAKEQYERASEVVQLYMDFPSSAEEPPRILKGFEKTSLMSGESETLTITLTPKDFSIFEASANEWVPIEGIFVIYAGTSSDNLSLSLEFERRGMS